MSVEHVTRTEFELYVKLTAESMASIAESTKESAKESREGNQILREYIIINNNKHEKTAEEIADIKEEQRLVRQIAEENAKLTSVANVFKKALIVVAIGALTASGAALYSHFNPAEPIKVVEVK